MTTQRLGFGPEETLSLKAGGIFFCFLSCHRARSFLVQAAFSHSLLIIFIGDHSQLFLETKVTAASSASSLCQAVFLVPSPLPPLWMVPVDFCTFLSLQQCTGTLAVGTLPCQEVLRAVQAGTERKGRGGGIGEAACQPAKTVSC